MVSLLKAVLIRSTAVGDSFYVGVTHERGEKQSVCVSSKARVFLLHGGSKRFFPAGRDRILRMFLGRSRSEIFED